VNSKRAGNLITRYSLDLYKSIRECPLHIVYLITHKERFKNNTPPYYYVGSKYNWMGDGTYYGSSTHPIMKSAKKEDLDFEILFWFDECTHQYLIDTEKRTQYNLNCVYDMKYFNMAYACTSVTSDKEKIKRRVDAFKKIANTVLDSGLKISQVWAQKAKQTWDEKDASGLTRRESSSKYRREWMLSQQPCGKTLAQIIQEKTISTNNLVGEDGLTGYQRQGKKLSKWLQEVDQITGLKNSELRVKNNPILKRVEVLGVCFYSKTDACNFLGIKKTALDNILKGKATVLTYNKLINVFSKEYLDIHFVKAPLSNCEPISICGLDFTSKREASNFFSFPKTSFEKFVKTGKPNKAIKKILLDYFGEDVYELHSNENSILK